MRTRQSDGDVRQRVPLWLASLLGVVAGLGLYASFPPLGWWPLAVPAVILALLVLRGRSIGGALLVGFLTGMAFMLPLTEWAADFLGDTPGSWVPWIALAFVESALLALLAAPITLLYRWLDRLFATRSGGVWGSAVVISIAWMAREEVVGSWPYGGFAWGRLGMSQAESPFAEVASWIGVSGLGLVMAFVAALVAEVMTRRGRAGSKRPRTVIVPVVAAVVVIAALVLVPAFPTTAAGSLRIASVQGNGPAAYMDERERYEVLQSQLDATVPIEGEDIDLLVWPEGGVDADPLTDEVAAAVLDGLAERVGAPVLMNAASGRGLDRGLPDTPIFNLSMLWTPGGAMQFHAKRNPIPFGEYVPDRDFFEAIAPDLIRLIAREYTPGTDAPIVRVEDATVGLAICFDVIDDDLIGEGIAAGAQVFVLQTNNADFRGTSENEQQLAFARMRAIETGRSVVNLSTTGTSEVIDPSGRTIDSIPIDEAAAMVTEVELRDGTTAGVVISGWIDEVILLAALLSLIVFGVISWRSSVPRSATDERRIEA